MKRQHVTSRLSLILLGASIAGCTRQIGAAPETILKGADIPVYRGTRPSEGVASPQTGTAERYGTPASCSTKGWSSSAMGGGAIEDHLTAMCCVRHFAEPIQGAHYFGVCHLAAYDWDCARSGGLKQDGTPGCPGSGAPAERWIAFFGFDKPPTEASQTAEAIASCLTTEASGFRYR